MSTLLGRPSFWTEPRDPWAWQRALRAIGEQPVADPTPCWESCLRGVLPRSAVAGLYGWKRKPQPGAVLGAGLLLAADGGWSLAPASLPLLDAARDDFPPMLADWLLRRSFWVRLALRRLGEGRWELPDGVAPLRARAIRVDIDLQVDTHDMSRCYELRLGSWAPEVGLVRMRRHVLTALHAPLHLLLSLGMLSEDGRLILPAEIADDLLPPTPAALLRRITREEADPSGFVPLERVASRLGVGWLRVEVYAGHAWSDRVFGRAFDTGAIEVHEWAPGQPRHGRGFLGDRSRKLVRWTIHDDFTLSRYPAQKELTG